MRTSPADGDPDTFWHSHWSGEAAQPPHFLVMDLAKELNVGAVVYTARPVVQAHPKKP